MTCCYQVTKIFSTRYSSAIASSAWGPCNFGPLTDLAISVFREMSINIVFTQILTSLEMLALMKFHEKNWRENLRVLEFHHPPKKNFLEFLQPFRDFRTQRVAPFDRGFLVVWFLDFIGLGFIKLP